MLLETVVSVLMSGLMTHVGNDAIVGTDPKSHVIVVRDQTDAGHTPILLVLTHGHVDVIYLKFGDRIRFEGLYAGTAKAQRDFQDYTPSLVDPINHGFLAHGPRVNLKHKNVFASMKYPEGTLSIPFYQEKEAKFMRGNHVVRHQCVPWATLFQSAKSEDEVVRLYIEPSREGFPIDLTGGAFLWLINQPLYHEADARPVDLKRHFANYAGVLKRRNLVTWARLATIESGESCDRPKTLPAEMKIIDVLQRLNEFLPSNINLLPVHDLSEEVALLNMRISADPSCTNTDWP